MPTSIPLLQIDAFTSRPFFGNPAAVMWLQHPHDDDWMQHVASEMNLSETAFLSPTDQTHRYGLRWFTPGREVDLCGHATIASMMALRHWGFITDAASVTFDSRSGDLHCELEGDMASLKFPATPVIE
ncbi:MAG: PhzF family phenazine biosynthesis isomerase, partial [Planctomycetota bacterium]